jgi:hypothetical protein
MITALVRQDPALRRLSPWLSMTAGVGLACLAALTLILYRSAHARTDPDHTLLFLVTFGVIWLSMSVYLLSSGARTRSTDFTLSLPIHARSLWTLHHVAVFLAGLATWALLAGVVFVGNRLIVLVGAPSLLSLADTVDLAVYLPAAFCLAIAVMQIPAQGQRTAPRNHAYVALWVVTVLATAALTLGLTLLHPTFAIMLPAAAIVVLAWTRQRVPVTFSVAGREAVVPAGGDGIGVVTEETWSALRRPSQGFAYRWFLFRTIHRAVAKKHILPIVGYPFMLLLGIALSGFFARFTSEGAIRYDLLIITVYMLLAFFGGLTTNLHRIDALPIARQRLFAMLILPPLLTLVVGYGIGLAGIRALGPPELVHFRTHECCDFIVVPPARCEIAWKGQVPDNGSPWGETHPAWSTPLFRGSRAVLYSPYSNVEASSRRYVAHQISRATEAVYNERVPEEVISSRYLETDDNDRVIGRQKDLTLLRDHPGLEPRSGGPAFPVIMFLVGVPAFLLAVFYLRAFRAGGSEAKRTMVLWAILALLLAFHLGQYSLFVLQFTEFWILAGLFKMGIRKLGEAFPGSTFAVWVVCSALLYVSYRTAERAFENIEVTPKRG